MSRILELKDTWIRREYCRLNASGNFKNFNVNWFPGSILPASYWYRWYSQPVYTLIFMKLFTKSAFHHQCNITRDRDGHWSVSHLISPNKPHPQKVLFAHFFSLVYKFWVKFPEEILIHCSWFYGQPICLIWVEHTHMSCVRFMHIHKLWSLVLCEAFCVGRSPHVDGVCTV